jgi:hypothetical protein
MKQKTLEAMSVDALYELYGEVSAVLEKRIHGRIDRLQLIFETLEIAPDLETLDVPKRRPPPKVPPKF